MINEGDIFEFPIPDGRKALAWVVYVSKRVEHMVGFVIFGVNNTLLSPDILSTRLLKMLGPFYTNEDNLGDYYDCKFFGNVEVSATQKAVMTTQIDGGAVMVGDDYIRAADVVDCQQVHQRLYAGMPVIVQEIERAFPFSAKINTTEGDFHYRAGDMIEIPFSESRVARCWIALVSKQFPQLVSFYVLGVGVGPFSRPGEAESRVRMLGPLYTYYHNLVDCHCRTIDHAPLSEKQKGMLTMRITNDGVYLGHEWVRKTRGADYDQLTSMLPLGLPVICKIIDKACSQPPDENVDWRDQIRCPMDAQAEKIWKRLDKKRRAANKIGPAIPPKAPERTSPLYEVQVCDRMLEILRQMHHL